MERPSEIGASIVIKGEITAREDIVVSGRVDGTISAGGHTVTVSAGAQVIADIHARAIVVSGKVLGTLTGEELVELRETADVEGELTAPALRLRDGALFKGKAESKKAKGNLQLAS